MGGFLTPYWVGTGQASPLGLLSYLLILDTGMGVLARGRRWFFLNLMSFVGTCVLFVGWSVFYTREALWTTQAFLILFAVLYIYLAQSTRRGLEKMGSRSRLAGPWTALVVLLFFIGSHLILAHEAAYYWGFILAFNALGLGVSLRFRSNWIAPGVFILTVLSIWIWTFLSYFGQERSLVWGCAGLLLAFFLVHGVLRRKRAVKAADSRDVLVGLGAGLGYFAHSYYLLAQDYMAWMAGLALGLAFVHLLAAGWAGRLGARARPLVLSFIGVALTLLTLAIPIQLEQDWITFGWAIESLVLVWIGFRVRAVRLRQGGLVVLFLSLFRLLTWDAVRSLPAYVLIFNPRMLTALSVIAVLYLMASLYRRNGSRIEALEKPVQHGLTLLASGITVILVSQESWAYHHAKLRQLNLGWALQQLGAAEYKMLVAQVRNRQGLVLSLLWASYSMAAVTVGIVRRYAPIRLFGIALFCLAILKVFLQDIWTLQPGYRIISVIGLGCLLLAMGFLYQRFKRHVAEG